jgi:hypothetical protein
MEIIQGANGWPKKLKFILEHNNRQLELKYAPQGWRDIEIEWQRNLKDSAGIYRTLSVPLKFVEEGADFMRSVLSNGLEETVFLKVYRHAYDTQQWKYTLEFNCKASLAESTDTDLFFECPFVDEGLSDYLNKHSSAKYEIQTGKDHKIEVPDGVYLNSEVSLVVSQTQYTAFSATYIITTVAINNVADKSIEFQDSPTIDDHMFIKHDNTPCKMNIKGKLKIFVISSENPRWHGPVTLHLRLNTNPDIGTHDIYTQDFELSTLGNEFEIEFNQNIEISYTGNYLLRALLTEQGGSETIYRTYWIIDSMTSDGTPDISFKFMSQTSPFSFYGMPLYSLFQKIIEKIYPDEFSITSNLLTQGIGKDIYVTSGDAIRGFDNAAIKITLGDLEKSAAAILAADFATHNNNYIIEEKQYFFKDIEIADIGEVNESEITIANDILANKIKTGYSVHDYNQDNGRDEFNITLNFEVKINNNNNELELTSLVRADSYGIQFTRINLEGKTATDSDSDNDPFFVHVKHNTNGTITVNKDITIINGSANKSGVFNAILSPKRCLLRHSGWLASIFDKTNKDIEFISSDRQDSNLESTDGTTTIIEKNNVPINSLTGKLFIPYYVEFDAPVPVGIAGNNGPFASNIFGYITFSINGYKLKGFPVNIMESMSEKKQQRCKLILHPDTPGDFIVKIREKSIIDI